MEYAERGAWFHRVPIDFESLALHHGGHHGFHPGISRPSQSFARYLPCLQPIETNHRLKNSQATTRHDSRSPHMAMARSVWTDRVAAVTDGQPVLFQGGIRTPAPHSRGFSVCPVWYARHETSSPQFGLNRTKPTVSATSAAFPSVLGGIRFFVQAAMRRGFPELAFPEREVV